jgi:hypothetical protein
METKPKGSLKRILGFLLSTVIVVGALYYYGLYRPAYEESKPPQIMSDSAFQGLLIDKTTKFFKFEFNDSANFKLITDHHEDVHGKEISFFYSVKPISTEDILRATYPVPGMKIAYADYSPDAEKMFHVYPDVSAHSNSRAVTVAEGDDYIIPAFRGFALIAFGDTKLYHPDLRSFEDVPTQEEIDAARELVLEEMAAAAQEPDANSSEGENGTANIKFSDLNASGNRTVAAGAGFCPEFPIPFEEEDWVLLPANDKNMFKKVMNCINSNVGYEAKYIWIQEGMNAWDRLDEDEIVLADEDTYAEVGESGYSMVWFKIGTYDVAAPDPVEPDPDPITCSYNNESYGVDTTFIAEDGCNECICSKDGVAKCAEEICESDSDPITCAYDGVPHGVSAIFDAVDECNICTCGETGEVACTTDKVCEPDPDPIAPQVVMAEYVDYDLEKVMVTFNKEVQCTLADKASCFTVYLNENEDPQDEPYIVVDAIPLVSEDGLTASIEWELTVDSKFTLGRNYVAEASPESVMLAGTDVGVDPEHNTAEFELPDPEVFVNPKVEKAEALNKTTISVEFDIPVDCVGGADACFSVEPEDPAAYTPVEVVEVVAVEEFPVQYHKKWVLTTEPGIDSSIEGDDDVVYVVTALTQDVGDVITGMVSEEGAGMGSPNSDSVNVVEPASFDIPQMMSAVADGLVIDVAFDMPVKCGEVADCVTVLSTEDANPDLVVVSIDAADGCDESDYCENWVVTVKKEGVQISPYDVMAPGMESEDGEKVVNSKQVSWPVPPVQPILESAEIIDNGTEIEVKFNVAVNGKDPDIATWFNIEGEGDLVLGILGDSVSEDCDGDYCDVWTFEVVETGVPVVNYTVTALKMESAEGLFAVNSKEVVWEDEPLVLIGAQGLGDDDPEARNSIGVGFSEPVSYEGTFKDAFVVLENDNPAVVLDVLSATPMEGENGCEGYPKCDLYVLELDQDLESEVEYLVLAKSSTDDPVNYITTYDNVSIDKDNNSAVVSITYEPDPDPILNVSLADSNPISKEIEKGVLEPFLAVDMFAEHGDVTVENMTLQLVDDGGNVVNFDNFEQLRVSTTTQIEDVLIQSDTNSLLVENAWIVKADENEVFNFRLKASEDVSAGKYKLRLKEVAVSDPVVIVNGTPVDGNFMEIPVILYVDASDSPPPTQEVFNGDQDVEYLKLDFTAESGDVILSGLNLSSESTVVISSGSGGGSPDHLESWENWTDLKIYEEGNSAQFEVLSEGIAPLDLNVSFSDPYEILNGETLTLVVSASINPETNNDGTMDRLGLLSFDDVFASSPLGGDLVYAGALESSLIWGNWVTIKNAFGFINSSSSTVPPLVFHNLFGTVIDSYITVNLGAKNGNILTNELKVGSSYGKFDSIDKFEVFVDDSKEGEFSVPDGYSESIISLMLNHPISVLKYDDVDIKLSVTVKGDAEADSVNSFYLDLDDFINDSYGNVWFENEFGYHTGKLFGSGVFVDGPTLDVVGWNSIIPLGVSAANNHLQYMNLNFQALYGAVTIDKMVFFVDGTLTSLDFEEIGLYKTGYEPDDLGDGLIGKIEFNGNESFGSFVIDFDEPLVVEKDSFVGARLYLTFANNANYNHFGKFKVTNLGSFSVDASHISFNLGSTNFCVGDDNCFEGNLIDIDPFQGWY